jgi:hypothetical protein
MTLWSFAAHSQIVINYQAPDSTQVTYEDSQFDITKKAGSYEFNGLDISKVNYITRFKTANTKEGHVTLPEGAPIDVSTLYVLGGGNKVRVDGQGYFSIPSNSMMVENSDGKMVYKAFVSLDDVESMAGIDVNSTETALCFLTPVITNLTSALPDEILFRIKELISELPETEALAKAIDRSVIKYGYLEMDEIRSEYINGVNVIMQKTGLKQMAEEARAKARNRTSGIIDHGDYKMETNYLEPGEVAIHDDMLEKERTTNGMKGSFHFWNTNYFSYKAITVCRKAEDDKVYVVDKRPQEIIKYILPPLRVSTFMDHILSLEGVIDWIQDSKSFFTGNFANMNSGFPDINYVHLDFSTQDDLIGLLGPVDSEVMNCYNTYLDLMATVLRDLVELAFSDKTMVNNMYNEIFCDMVSDADFWHRYLSIATHEPVDNKALFNLYWEYIKEGKGAAMKELARKALTFNRAIGDILGNYDTYLKEVEMGGDLIMSLLGLEEKSIFLCLDNGELDNLPTYQSLLPEKPQPRTEFYVTYSSEDNGKVMAKRDGQPVSDNPIKYNRDESITLDFEAIPDDGYTLNYWKVNGVVSYSTVNQIRMSFGGYHSDTKISASFRKLDMEKTRFVSGRHGSVTAEWMGMPVISGETLLPDTATVIHTAKPDKGYRVKRWIQSGIEWATDNKEYRCGPTPFINLIVEFEQDPDYDYTKDPEYDPNKTDHLAVESQIVNGVIEKNSSGTITISSGSGLYKASSSNEIAFTTELRDNVVTVYAVRSGYSEVITITDLVTGETQTVNVSCDKKELKVGLTELSIYDGELAVIDILQGSGNYQLINGENKYTKAKINSDAIRVQGLKPGEATITLKDVYLSDMVEIKVSVKESNFNLGINAISLEKGKYARIKLDKSCNSYSVQTTSNAIYTSFNGLADAYLIISAIDFGSGEVIVTDKKTGAKYTISVTVHANEGTIFTAKNDDGIAITYKVLSIDEFTCEVSRQNEFPAIGNYDIYLATNGVLRIPEGVNQFTVTSIGDGAFDNCYNLTSVFIPNSVTSIGERAFSRCTGLTSVDIPNNIISIGQNAFFYCKKLSSFAIPNGATSVGNRAFQGCSGLKSVDINSVTSIGEYAFSGCEDLTTLVIRNGDIPNSVTHISQYAFENCYHLSSFVIPTSVISIGDYAFKNCSSLTSVDVPKSITSIGKGAFQGCSNLTSFIIPDGVKSIASSLFSKCSSLKSVFIPNSVKSIGDFAFNDCKALKSVNIPYGVTSINEATFQHCESLTDLTIPNTVTSIGSWAFSGCLSLKNMVIPNGVTSIGYLTFQNTGLISVTIPNSVKSIEERAFSLTRNLTTVISEILEPFELSGVFEYSPQDTLYVPKGTQNIYKTTEGWNHFKNIVEFDGDYPSYETYPDLQLYKYNVEEAVSTTECVGIVSGSGSYQVESSNDNIAEAKLNWQLVCILAKAPGTATITVTDLKTGQVKTIYVKVHDGQSGQDEIWKSKIADLTYERDKLEKELKEKATEEGAPELYAMLRDIDSYISAMDSDWRNGKFASLEKYETDIKQRLEQLKKAIDALGK